MQCKAVELFGRGQLGGVDGDVKASAAAHPWTLAVAAAVVGVLAAAAAAAAAAGGGQLRLLCSACIGVGSLTCRLVLCARGPGRQGGGSSAHFAWLPSGLGR